MPRRIDALTVYGVAFLIFLYAPVLLLPMFSFNDNTFAVFPLVGFTTSAYVELANNDSLLNALRNSLIVGTFVSIFSTIFGLLAAMAATRYRMPGRGPVMGVIMLPLVFRLSHAPGPAERAGRSRPTALWAAGLAALGAAGLQVAGQRQSLVGLLAGLAGLVAVGVSLPNLMPAGFFRFRPGLAPVISVRTLMAGAFFGAEAFVPLMIVEQRHLSLLVAGSTLTVGARASSQASATLWGLTSWRFATSANASCRLPRSPALLMPPSGLHGRKAMPSSAHRSSSGRLLRKAGENWFCTDTSRPPSTSRASRIWAGSALEMPAISMTPSSSRSTSAPTDSA